MQEYDLWLNPVLCHHVKIIVFERKSTKLSVPTTHLLQTSILLYKKITKMISHQLHIQSLSSSYIRPCSSTAIAIILSENLNEESPVFLFEA